MACLSVGSLRSAAARWVLPSPEWLASALPLIMVSPLEPVLALLEAELLEPVLALLEAELLEPERHPEESSPRPRS